MRWNDVPRGTMDEARSHVRLDLPSANGKAAVKIVPPRSRTPCWKGPGADSEEKHEPASDTDTVLVESLKALDPVRPIREADIIQGKADINKCSLMTERGQYRRDRLERMRTMLLEWRSRRH